MMKAIAHGDHLLQLTRMGISNCYLVREDDGLTLIDTSLPGSAKGILAQVEQLGEPLRRILITHAHTDHYGSLDALRKQRPDVDVAMSARDARFLAGDRSRLEGEPEGRIFAPFFPKAKTQPRAIGAGDRIGSLEAIAAPGHTPGQLAYLDTRDRTLICGDAYLALGGLFVTTQPVARFPFPALLGTWNKAIAFETAVKLRSLDPSRLATGHGRVLDDPGAEMDRALAKAPRG